MDTAFRRQNNVIVRLHPPRPVFLIQLADLDAAGATRVAGTANFKGKYAPAFTTIALQPPNPA